jgi:CheY-like chemotaxis protein
MDHKRVLVVDDEEQVRLVLRRWIEADGHEVREAESAERALTVLEGWPAEIAFCDVQMGGNDGLWLTREIRTRFPSTVVVLATVISSVPPALSMQAGVVAYLVKPFERAAVAKAIGLSDTFAGRAVTSRQDDGGLDAWLASLEKGL